VNARAGGKHFEDSKNFVARAQRNCNHGADAESPAVLFIDATVGFGVVAVQGFSGANALAENPILLVVWRHGGASGLRSPGKHGSGTSAARAIAAPVA